MADHVAELVDLVRAAGGTLRFHGREVKDAAELRAIAERSLAERLAAAETPPLRDVVRAYVAAVFERCGRNQSETARRLGVDRGTVVRILRLAR